MTHTEKRARDLAVGDWFREYGDDPEDCIYVGEIEPGDSTVIRDGDIEVRLDGDEVVEVVR